MRASTLFIYIILITLLHACADGAYAQRERYIDSLEKILHNVKTDSDKVKILTELSDARSCKDSILKRKLLDDALSLAEKLHWDRGVRLVNITLAGMYFECYKNYPEAIRFYENIISEATKANDVRQMATCFRGLAMAHQALAQYGKACQYYKRSFAVGISDDDRITALGNLGLVYSKVGDYVNSIIYYDSSLKTLNKYIKLKKVSDADDTMQIAALLITKGDIYLSVAQFDKALESYGDVWKISRQTGNKLQAVWALTGIGNVYHSAKNFNQTVEYYNKALAECRNTTITYDYAANIYNKLGSFYLENGNVSMAKVYADSSLAIAEKNSFADQLPVTYTTLGNIYTQQGKYADAVNYLEKAVRISHSGGALDAEKDALQALSNTYELMHKPELAMTAFKQYIAIRDSIHNIATSNEFIRMDMNSEYRTDSLKHADEYRMKMQKQKVYTYSGFAGLIFVLSISFFFYRSYNQQKKTNIIISKASETISDEKQRAEALLLNILPENVANELKSKGNVQARLFDHVTVMFTDFVNFTEAGERFSPEELVAELHTCFMAFDRIVGKYNIEKIKTVGDAYLAVSGLPHPNLHHASDIVKAALECRDFMIARKKKLGNRTFSMRIGINTGTVVAGIVGVKKFAYDIWGDTVNTAARMEQYSDPDKINISHITYELIKDQFTCTDRGEIDAKHKGKMRMYFVEG